MSTSFQCQAVVVAAAVASLPAYGIAASSAYVGATQDLDLHRVRLEVVASAEHTVRLQNRVLDLLAKAGLPRPMTTESPTPPVATLMLVLDPSPIEQTCPGQVLYDPALTLTEPVLIPRNAAVLNDTTWIMRAGPQVRGAMEFAQFEMDLDELVGQFITDYHAANKTAPSPENRAAVDPPQQPPPPADSIPDAAHSTAGLDHLTLTTVQLTVQAGRWTPGLRTRAMQQVTEAELPVSPEQGGESPITLAIEFTQQSLEDDCPGHVMYTRGLYLVEEVRIARNPRVSLWSDTWLRDRMEIVPPVSVLQLEFDQDALVREFTRALRATSPE